MVLPQKSPRRKKKYWKKHETDMLIQGVEKYGKSWSTILKIYPDLKNNGRTQVDLKDKWRNIQRSKSKTLVRKNDGGFYRKSKIKTKPRKSLKRSRPKSKRKSLKRSRPKYKRKSLKRSRPKSKRKSLKRSRPKYKRKSLKRSRPKSKRKSLKKSRPKSKRKSLKRSKSKTSTVIYTIYTKEGCPYCKNTKDLLKLNKKKFKEIKVTDKNKEIIYKKIDTKTNNYRYFPIIFKKNKFIGGFSDLDKNNL